MSYSSSGPDKSSQVYYALACESTNSTDDTTEHKHRHHHGVGNDRKHHVDTQQPEDHHRGHKDIEGVLEFKGNAEDTVLVSRDDTDHMMFSSASSAKPIGYNALNWAQEQIGKMKELTLSNCIESIHRWYKGDVINIQTPTVVMKDSEIVLGNVSNLDDLMMDTNILSSQDAVELKHVPLLSNESTTDLVSTNPVFNINGTLMLGNLVVRMMNPVHDNTTSNTINDTTFNNQVVDLEYAQRLAYNGYTPNIDGNEDNVDLLG